MRSSWRSCGNAPPAFGRALSACVLPSCARPAWRYIANCRAPTRSARTRVGAGLIRPATALTRAMPAVFVTVLAGDYRPACDTLAGCFRLDPFLVGDLSAPHPALLALG